MQARAANECAASTATLPIEDVEIRKSHAHDDPDGAVQDALLLEAATILNLHAQAVAIQNIWNLVCFTTGK